MTTNEGSGFKLPSGLPLEPGSPEWLTTHWPMVNLSTDIASVISIIAIFFGIGVVLLISAWLAKTFLPNWAKGLAKILLIVAACGSFVAGGLAGVSWSSDKAKISDYSLGVEVTRTTNWMKAQGVSADNRQVWDLVCFYYSDRNDNCRKKHPEVIYQGKKTSVRLEAQKDGSVILYDYQNKKPLVVK